MQSYLAAFAISLLVSASALAQQPAMQQAPTGTGANDAQQQPQQPGKGELASRFVKQIQARLHQQGYLDAKPTGIWDDATSDALQSFQESNGIEGTGKLDSITLLTLGITSRLQQMQTAQAPQASRPGGAGEEGGAAGSGSSVNPTTSPGMAQSDARALLLDAFEAGYMRGFAQGLRQNIEAGKGGSAPAGPAPQ